MEPAVRDKILYLTDASGILRTEVIQPLWNQYGTLSRVWLEGGLASSVIVKHIQIPEVRSHPRGFVSSLSRERKIHSYQVETHWYQHQNRLCPTISPTPACLGSVSESGELFLVLEDLRNRGFEDIVYDASLVEITLVLRWLASFHARFLGDMGQGLWAVGTYWHLATRPEELENIRGTELHRFASLLDARLRCDRFPTLVHGDAKLANFLFSKERNSVAAVDFQYVGQGSAMKDVAYFLGSCLSGTDCESREQELLEVYFSSLHQCLEPRVNGQDLEAEWRFLFPLAWADFQRFMLGWSPGHRKLTEYSDAITQTAIQTMSEELCSAAREACLVAGQILRSRRDQRLEVWSKGIGSDAADVCTQADIEAQEAIFECLSWTIERYDLGWLAEEGEADGSRLHKHAFWVVDPMDGTRFYVDGESGYAVSVALVSQAGEVLLGAVYDPVDDRLFEAVRGRGVRLNGKPLEKSDGSSLNSERVQCFADQSLKKTPGFNGLQEKADIHFAGGAVINALSVLLNPKSVYLKAPKKSLGGGAVWDFAAVSLILEEQGGLVRTYDGEPIHWNRKDTVYFNDTGVVFYGSMMEPDDRFWELFLDPCLDR